MPQNGLLQSLVIRSSLDTKEGYKTKAGSTSSVTLTLTLTRIKHWDRAGGGRNIV